MHSPAFPAQLGMTHRVHELGCPPKVAVNLKADDAAEARHLLHRDGVVWMTLQACGRNARMTTQCHRTWHGRPQGG